MAHSFAGTVENPIILKTIFSFFHEKFEVVLNAPFVQSTLLLLIFSGLNFRDFFYLFLFIYFFNFLFIAYNKKNLLTTLTKKINKKTTYKAYE